ncbi:MAG: nicotinate-nucleotide adenylyltransferase [Eubacteriales bacterium]|nr:nicotinate-nucleotide adenylyltransferase [Eubacteriales bacterium]
MARERIGIMGGSFNPVHERHIEMARGALEELKLDRILFMPTGNPPHKHDELADAEHRYEMTRLAVLDKPGLFTSRLELEREGVIYTVDTLTLLRKQHPNADLFFLIGEDTMADLLNWRKPDKVFTLCTFAVCCRSTSEPRTNPVYRQLVLRGAHLVFLTLPPDNVSSTEIRVSLAAGKEPEHLPPQVMEYIRIMGLYHVPQSPVGADQLYPKLRQALSEKRLVHSLLVADTARKLALRYHEDPERAELAGLLHDCAKCMPLTVQQAIAQKQRLLLDKEIVQSENLLHGYVGAAVAEESYGVTDPNVLAAIRCHTTGKVGMLPLDMILFLADKIEPSRRSYPALEEVRRLAEENLIDAMRYSLLSTLDYVRKQNRTPHPTTQRVVDWLNRLQNK